MPFSTASRLRALTILVVFAIASAHARSLCAQEIRKVSVPAPPDMTRSDLYVLETPWRPTAVLVLCPGANGNGESLVRQKEWQAFAKEHQLGLAGLSFASPEECLSDCGRGYYCASKGSGKALLDAIRLAYGRNNGGADGASHSQMHGSAGASPSQLQDLAEASRAQSDLPLLLYGFSGGAHFTSGFVEWNPGRVIAWCAYSAGWWDTPKKASHNPPGIVACGDEDPRYGASMIYFKQGRAAGKPWLWISLAKTGHNTAPALEAFVRQYFRVILQRSSSSLGGKPGLWVDVDRNTEASERLRKEVPCLTGWLPEASLLESWKGINQP